ncbi:MAG: hypothetical protein AB1584_12680 [Pseudomonadota bacterium]
MKRRSLVLVLAAAAAIFGLGAWQQRPASTAAATMLSLRVGQSFGEVVSASSYPVMQHSIVPSEETDFSGGTFVQEPAVALCFNDPQHGFILPPTKFALVAYAYNVVATATTSPMLDKLPFDQAVSILENLQNQFRAGGWEPRTVGAGNKWFDLTPDGKKRLYQRMFEPGYSQTAELRVPKKYGMTFRLKCTDGCWPDEKPPHLFLIDVSVGMDTFGSEPEDPEVWDHSFPGNAAPTGPARFSCPAGRAH